jgi:hypothetical protein
MGVLALMSQEALNGAVIAWGFISLVVGAIASSIITGLVVFLIGMTIIALVWTGQGTQRYCQHHHNPDRCGSQRSDK